MLWLDVFGSGNAVLGETSFLHIPSMLLTNSFQWFKISYLVSATKLKTCTIRLMNWTIENVN
jgi:hypothetical protein